MGNLGLLIDVFGAILLIVVIVYAFRLNRSLSALKSNKAELDGLITTFTNSTNRAEASVARLKASATETATALQTSVSKAQELRDDLAFMTDRAEELANRLESAISSARTATPRATEVPKRETESAEPPKGNADQDQRGKSKAELLRALQGMR
jgi:chromosome segregation ATPase